jgi:DNA invertase Pin-like site-specific DNA recombinase
MAQDSAVAIYARVSSDKQAKDDTIASQIEQLEHRVRDDGFALD